MWTGWKNAPSPRVKSGICDAIARAEQHHHRLADDAAEAEQDGRDDAGKRGRDEDARDGLQAIRAERVGGFLEAARHIAQRVFRRA